MRRRAAVSAWLLIGIFYTGDKVMSKDARLLWIVFCRSIVEGSSHLLRGGSFCCSTCSVKGTAACLIRLKPERTQPGRIGLRWLCRKDATSGEQDVSRKLRSPSKRWRGKQRPKVKLAIGR